MHHGNSLSNCGAVPDAALRNDQSKRLRGVHKAHRADCSSHRTCARPTTLSGACYIRCSTRRPFQSIASRHWCCLPCWRCTDRGTCAYEPCRGSQLNTWPTRPGETRHCPQQREPEQEQEQPQRVPEGALLSFAVSVQPLWWSLSGQLSLCSQGQRLGPQWHLPRTRPCGSHSTCFPSAFPPSVQLYTWYCTPAL